MDDNLTAKENGSSNDVLPPMRKSLFPKWSKQLLLILLISFFSGIVGGAVTIKFFGPYFTGHRLPPPPPKPEMIIEKMKADLNLSEDQVKRLFQILKDSENSMKKLQQATMDEMRKFEDSVCKILTPEQVKIFHDKMKRRKEHFRDFERERRFGTPHTFPPVEQ